MKILVVAPFIPGPNVDHAGGRDLFFMMKGLAERHRISLLALDTDGEGSRLGKACWAFYERVEIVPLRTTLYSKAARFLKHMRWPRAAAMFHSPEMKRRVKELLRTENFDLVQFENIQTIPYMDHCPLPKVFDCIDLSFLPFFQQHMAGRGTLLRRIYRALEWPRMMLCETGAIRQVDGVIARSDRDASLIQTLNPRAAVAITQVWPLTHEWAADPERRRPRLRPQKPIVMFVGAMWRPINSEACLHFLDRIWPAIKRAVPEAEFWVVGASPPDCLKARTADGSVVVTGFVQDLLPYYKDCAVQIVPLLAAGGIINKVTDAMHVGIPVVATSVSNQGIGAENGRDILIEDDADRFADAVVRLLTDDRLYAQISQNSESYIKSRFDWNASIRAVEALYEKVADQGRHQKQ